MHVLKGINEELARVVKRTTLVGSYFRLVLGRGIQTWHDPGSHHLAQAHTQATTVALPTFPLRSSLLAPEIRPCASRRVTKRERHGVAHGASQAAEHGCNRLPASNPCTRERSGWDSLETTLVNAPSSQKRAQVSH